MPIVRVRIAPSPTGDLHVGTAYIALFNYCFARSHGGQFILRIEDTDQTRSRRQYEDRIYEGLEWLGLRPDEGPHVGGPCGPYRQSDRSDIYREHCARLVASGNAYPCFCSPETLDQMRREQQAAKAMLGYDGRCKRLDPAEVQRRLAAGEPHVIRLAVPKEGVCVIHDQLFGEVHYPFAQIDDQVLLKSDGMPTYHLANVVDDHLMGITHVIRGEEWLPSTPKHIRLYEAFGWQPPVWSHIPLLLNPDRSKLSKRKNPTSIFYYRDAGFLPEALLNYLALIGYSRPGAGGQADEMFSIDDLIATFDLKNVSLGGSVFDMQKLLWLNGRYIREKMTPADVLERMKQWRLNDAFWLPIIQMMQPRLETFGDMMGKSKFFFLRETPLDPAAVVPKGREAADLAAALQCLLWEFEHKDDWSVAGVEAAIQEVVAYLNWKTRDLAVPLFVVITGEQVGPPLYDSMSLLGKDLCRMRLMTAIQQLGAPGKKKLAELEKAYKSRPPRA